MPDEFPVATVAAADREADARTIAALRAGEEAAFAALIDMHGAALERLALHYVHDRTLAQEVVQEAWLGLLTSLPRFEGRSSLKTWLFRILVNCARTRARKESRSIAFSEIDPDGEGGRGERAVSRWRFFPLPGTPLDGHWMRAPRAWEQEPEASALSAETRACIEAAVAALPPQQREVITMRDIGGLSAEEVCSVLGVTDTNQRVLLHRARGKVRRALEAYMGEAG